MKILIIRFSSIGDIVLTTPIIRCLRKAYPESQIHYLTKYNFRSSIANNPYINFYHLHKNDINKTIAELKKEDFDYVIDLHHNFRSAIVKLRLGVKSYSFPKLNFEKWLLVKFKINRLPSIHIVDRFFQTVAPLGVKNDGQGLDFFIPDVDVVSPAIYGTQFSSGYVALVLGGTFDTKKLPIQKVIQLCLQISHPIILLGGRAELESAEVIVKNLGHNKVYCAVNKLTIAQSASLIKQANVVITNDTGMMHIAAAFKKRIISVWGNTLPEFGMTPYYGNKELELQRSTMVEVRNLSCRPCSKLGYSSCPQKHFRCMNEISESTILDAVNIAKF